jgi:N-acetylglucosaminyldiphosphoundecaprenol N-acetyl-beta-D-mannosaminyltransferase
MRAATLLGIRIDAVGARSLVSTLVGWAAGPIQSRAFYVNVHAMNLAHRDPGFRAALQSADLVFCDGYGVKWGARLAGVRIPHRLTPPDWIDAFATATAAAGQPVFALGDEPGVAEAFQSMLADRHPGYRAAGSHHGFFDPHGEDAVIERINASGAVHLLVGMGMPRQELWLVANAHRLRPRVLVPVGALFRWYTGVERRAPRWVTDSGLEWASRFVRHPVRHFRRYVLGNPAFIMRVIASRLRKPAP